MAELKKSLNPIPPTLRGKKRYVKFMLICNAPLDEKRVWQGILGVFQLIFGGKGVAEQRLWLVKWSPVKNEGVMRCSLSEEENVKAGILFVQKIGLLPVIPAILKVSGSMNKLN